MPDDEAPQSSIILYQTEDGRTRIQCRFENETIWLTQALIAELFQKDVRTINEHLVNIFDEGELSREATVRKFRIVRREGARDVAREIEHYSLPAILAVGYRVRSPRGTQFRQWATARLNEYLVKGFTLDDEALSLKGRTVEPYKSSSACSSRTRKPFASMFFRTSPAGSRAGFEWFRWVNQTFTLPSRTSGPSSSIVSVTSGCLILVTSRSGSSSGE